MKHFDYEIEVRIVNVVIIKYYKGEFVEKGIK